MFDFVHPTDIDDCLIIDEEDRGGRRGRGYQRSCDTFTVCGGTPFPTPTHTTTATTSISPTFSSSSNSTVVAMAEIDAYSEEEGVISQDGTSETLAATQNNDATRGLWAGLAFAGICVLTLSINLRRHHHQKQGGNLNNQNTPTATSCTTKTELQQTIRQQCTEIEQLQHEIQRLKKSLQTQQREQGGEEDEESSILHTSDWPSICSTIEEDRHNNERSKMIPPSNGTNNKMKGKHHSTSLDRDDLEKDSRKTLEKPWDEPSEKM